MTKSRGYALAMWLLVVILMVSSAVAQETTAGLQGTVKDQTGAVISKAVVEVSGPSLIGSKKAETDASGYYRFANLPPGEYTITVTAQGFRILKQSGLVLEVGKLPTMDLKLEVGTSSQVVEVSSAAPLVDVTQSKVQTNVTEDVLNYVPKGRSFQSVIQFAPGARSEPLQGGGYQIDGASNSENAYLIEGQETAAIQTGASNTNMPMEFIQEVQVKSSGFEAEYGGALGGVVNVVQKRGGNAWHGSVFMSFRSDALNAAPGRTLRYDPNSKKNTGTRTDSIVQYYQPKKDHARILDPGFEVGGYVVKDRLWVFLGTAPDIDQESRTVNFVGTGNQTFSYNSNTYYSQARVDYLATQKIRLYGSWMYNYQKVQGNSWPTADSVFSNQFNGSSQTSPNNYGYQIGFVAPNVLYNTGADITITPNLIATSRFGYQFYDYQDRGLPVGVRYRYVNSNYSYGPISAVGATSLTGFGGPAGTPLPSAFALSANYSNIGANLAYLFNKFSRTSFAQDLAYFKKGFLGTHNFKFGYAFNRLWNDDTYGYNTSQAYVAYGTPYTPLTSNYGVCQAITASNAANGWGNRAPGTLGPNDPGSTGGVTPAQAGTGSACTGLWGTLNIREYGEFGSASSFNHALYFQDAWTLGHGVTLNLGVRMDKENVPSFTKSFPGISFGFGEKTAPRLGGSWDILGNGKLKLYGSYGWFFDIMKYELPKGSFGGNYWHDCVYALDTYDWTTIVPVRGANGHFCNPTGGANFAGGSTPSGLRFIENQDYRTYSNDPNAPGSLGPTGYIDPNLKPMKQHEYTAGLDWAITPTLALETRYSRKRLDRTIEDAGHFTPAGEQYYIVNPGYGVDVQPIGSSECTDCPVQPKATRNYDGLEFRLTRRGAGRWFGSVSYTYSRFYGNYSGLTSTDVSDSGTVNPGRNSPNVDRAFDEPYMQFDSHGKYINGPLATDRPHTFKAYGYYRLKWWNQETLIGGFQQWYSGTPLSTYANIQGAPVFLENRGGWADVTRGPNGTWVLNGVSNRRTDPFAQTDFSIVQEMKVNKTNEAMRVGLELNVTNLFNQRAGTIYSQELGASSAIIPVGGAATLYHDLTHPYNYISTANANGLILNGQYGMPITFQAGRAVRLKIRFTF